MKGYENVADGSEVVVNCFGVRSCGRLPLKMPPTVRNRWGLECMDFGDASLCHGWMERKQHLSRPAAAFKPAESWAEYENQRRQT